MRLVCAAVVGVRLGLFFVRPPEWFLRVGDRVFKEPGR